MDDPPDLKAGPAAPWEFRVDTGGTFTDCVAVDPGGHMHRAKVLSTSAVRGTVLSAADGASLVVDLQVPGTGKGLEGCDFRLQGGAHSPAKVARFERGAGRLHLDSAIAPLPAAGATFEIVSAEEAPLFAARLVTGTGAGEPLPPLRMRLATTRGTNALLERRGGRVALFITAGHGDLLRIGTQQRPDLFALDIRRPAPLYEAVVEVDERLAADGSVLRPIALAAARHEVERLIEAGISEAAIAFLHAYRNPAHEQALEGVLREAGFRHVARSSAGSPAIKLLPRAETAVVDAYLAPVIDAYLSDVRRGLGTGGLHVMTSAGGLVGPGAFRARDSLLSGPAGGVVGAALAGRREGHERLIAFDMGGTSTDVSRVDGDFEYVWEHEVGGVRLAAPALAIHTVAAGGGSVCSVTENGLRVGPESAGAAPGPACYGFGGPLTLTDVNLLLGRLDATRFGVPLRTEAARAAADQLLSAPALRDDAAGAPERLLQGLLDIADERMADAIREISVRRGYDPADYALVAFGGAGGQHACSLARLLGVRTVIVPPDAGLLSAVGLGRAVIERIVGRQVLMPLEEAGGKVGEWLDELGRRAAVADEGVAGTDIDVRRRIAEVRYLGQETSLEVDLDPGSDLQALFEERHRAVYGFLPDPRPIELVSLRVIASTRPEAVAPAPPPVPAPARTERTHRMWLGDGWREVPVFDRAEMRPGHTLSGPALISERHSATVVEAGWEAAISATGGIVLMAAGAPAPGMAARETPAAVAEELFTHRFGALVAEMGEMLRRTALSTNVKERLDFSCALLDAEGELVVNAPHIPVHLGALGACVRSVAGQLELGPGDVAVTNHPAFGGSHLPDVTVITPVHLEDALLGYVACRAHHAEIGGSRPGSMPPGATRLSEEGVVISPRYLIRHGAARWDELERLLSGARFPSRNVADNLADLAAQVAANRRGAELLEDLGRAHGPRTVRHHMQALTDRADRSMRRTLAGLEGGGFHAVETLDDGTPLAVRIEVRDERALIDFAGTGAVHPGNLNATPAIVRSVVLYVLRLLTDEPLPLNEGLLRAVELRIPEGILNPVFPPDPEACPAVVGGNVETSQRLVDTLLRALGLAACSQGTMNNVLFGSETFGYYETICGGAGAGPGRQGADAVHTHMTNTRITDPEILEHRYPVRLERFAVRPGSGGAGRWRGGNGVIREIAFLAPADLSVITQHRASGPCGMEGGGAGAPGRQHVRRADGTVLPLGSIDGCRMEAGDALIVETPGGGGWGAA
jgi:5-oxoprolinase (ATP-hydrolysing)